MKKELVINKLTIKIPTHFASGAISGLYDRRSYIYQEKIISLGAAIAGTIAPNNCGNDLSSWKDPL